MPQLKDLGNSFNHSSICGQGTAFPGHGLQRRRSRFQGLCLTGQHELLCRATQFLRSTGTKFQVIRARQSYFS
jgi:hypothetical protein